MKNCFIILALIAVLSVVTHTQTPYDYTKDYNFTYIDIYTVEQCMTKICEVLSPDGTYCLQCKAGAMRMDDYNNGVISKIGWCMFDYISDNCHGFDWSYNCALCHDGFSLNVSLTNDRHTCVPKTHGCAVYDSVALKCKTCMPGWAMNTSVNSWSNLTEYFCYFVPDVNCVKYDANKVCQGCVTNYAVVNNKCVLWYQNCATMNGNVCSKCKTNFQLDSTGRCVGIPKIANCASQVDYTCSSCLTGFNLVNNQCVAPVTIANCAQTSGTVCAKCNSGYFITTDGKCDLIPKISNCLTQVDFTCSSCITGYNLTNNICVYHIENCLQVNGMICSQCFTNYEVTSDGKCSRIAPISNCEIQLNYNCISCLADYALADNKCTYIIDNCAVVDGMNCAKCNTGFDVTTNGQCAPIPKVPNCISQIDYTCQACIDGWTLSNNQCTYVIDNCALVTDMVCSKCNTDYSITSDGKCSYIPRVVNCQSQLDFTCSSCVSGYALIENSCIYVIENCAQVSGMTCAQCNTDYAITSDGKCQSIPKVANCASQVDFTCQSCLTGFILSNNQCTPATQNCLEYTGATCSRCQNNYQLTNSLTCILIPRVVNCANQIGIRCMICSPGFTLANNACLFRIDNCLKVTGTVCEQCNTGFVVASDGKCVDDPFAGLDLNCRLYDSATFNKCLACSGGFFLNTLGKCEQVDPLCRNFNAKNGFCLSCYAGYNLDNARGKCIRASSLSSQTGTDHCHQYDWSRNVCVKCAEGCYFDADGKCQKFSDEYCKTPSADLKTCAECYKGYTFDQTQGKCIVGNFNCATWSNGKCATCPKGYYLSENSQCIQTDPFCFVFNQMKKSCLVCYPGYVMDSEKRCKLIQDVSPQEAKYSLNCAKFVEGQCTECYFGYYVTKDSVGSYCAKVSDLCRGHSKLTGKCTSCYLGYYLSTQGECLRFF